MMENNLPVCPTKRRGVAFSFFHDLMLNTLRAKMTVPSITPNRMAGMLPVSMKYKKPPMERKQPA